MNQENQEQEARPVQVIVKHGDNESMIRLTVAEAGSFIFRPIEQAIDDGEGAWESFRTDPERHASLNRWAEGLYAVTGPGHEERERERKRAADRAALLPAVIAAFDHSTEEFFTRVERETQRLDITDTKTILDVIEHYCGSDVVDSYREWLDEDAESDEP